MSGPLMCPISIRKRLTDPTRCGIMPLIDWAHYTARCIKWFYWFSPAKLPDTASATVSGWTVKIVPTVLSIFDPSPFPKLLIGRRPVSSVQNAPSAEFVFVLLFPGG
jgi:hypothetical protein